jgi:two-component system chemotaxis sensor kinase CheA
MPEVREAAGKVRTGTVTLSASQEGDHILLTIRDDGAGMDPEKLKKIAINKGVIDSDQASRLSDTEAYNLIFAPGFSTKEEISDISGRGVGMDVVKTKITQLNGSINIQSELGVGTILEIKVPLTLAILPTLMVIVGEQTFALPLAGVSEIFHLDLTKTNIVDGQLTIIVREKAIPLFYLEHWLVKGADRNRRKAEGHVVIVQMGTKQVGFVVDSLIGQEEVVIKPLDALLQGTPGMAGATITSDGGIALILDVPNMLKHYAGK